MRLRRYSFEEEVDREGGAMERPGAYAQYWPRSLVLAR